MSASTLDDEVMSLNSIYGDGTLVVSAASSDQAGTEGTDGILRLPSHPTISLRVFFPATYADDPPAVLGTNSVGEGLLKGAGQAAVRIARKLLEDTFKPGQPCLFDITEELGDALNAELDTLSRSNGAEGHGKELETLQDSCVERETNSAAPTQAELLGSAPEWTIGALITEKKSVFLARCVQADSVKEAQQSVAHLVATDRRAARATHNISAWRIRSLVNGSEVTYQDFDEDGETAAGGRVLRLLQMMDVWNVVVVISRWYGGILLGPARFALINEAAREVVVAWQEEHGGSEVKGKGKNEAKGGKKGKR
jgi:hypothetical protein